MLLLVKAGPYSRKQVQQTLSLKRNCGLNNCEIDNFGVSCSRKVDQSSVHSEDVHPELSAK